jgi:hypothetical protein
MAFSEIYDITFPPDTQAANQLGLDIRNFKNDIAQRIANLSGISLAAAEGLGFESAFYGAPFIDASTGKIYNVGATFPELTQLTGASIFTETASTSAMQAALVTAIASLVAPNTLVLPPLTTIQSPQITSGPGADIPTVVTPPTGSNTNQIPNTAWVLANTVPVVASGGGVSVFKIPLTFPASPGGAPVTYLTIQGGLDNTSANPSTVTYSLTYISPPIFICAPYNPGGAGSITVESIGTGSASVGVGGSATGIVWCAIGITN